MKKISILVSGFVMVIFLLALQQEQTLTIYIIGDSTAANKDKRTFPETGWGMAFAKLFDQQVKVDNRALNGRSTKSFKQDIGKDGSIVNHWEPIFENLRRGDYVFIQFGHNDEKVDKPNVGTSLEEFEQNLIFYIKQTREKGGIPILLTPIARRKFENGLLIKTHGEYPAIIRKVAADTQTAYIDMEDKTTKLVQSYGDEGSKKLFLHVESGDRNYPQGKKDDTHLNTFGASEVAKLVAEGIRELQLTIQNNLVLK
ncbi:MULTISPECIES: rhamnogalacturonan acetylesterase [Sphingobacterium]|uniref:rhamnogalacturonan acetylesterase n=1 Tax=Sphingobacterium TaxID=28453 RepID=UPI000B49646F|nr:MULTISPECIES: rhamnogalacturonan acetylesterase [Sphingobacterium]